MTTTNNAPASQEAEESPELVAHAQLCQDINAQVERVKSLHRSGQLTPDVAIDELCETFLPLLQDVAERAYHTQRANEDYMDAVDEKLFDGEGPAAPDAEEDAPGLWPEDARVFKMLLTEYRAVLDKLDDSGAVSERVQLIDKALARIDELTLDDEEDGDEEAGPPN